MKTIQTNSWRQTRRVYSHEIPRSVRTSLLGYAEEQKHYTVSTLSDELQIPVDLVVRYCRLLEIHIAYNWYYDEQVICGFRR